MILHLWPPILLSGIALFFVSFLSWMVLGLHKADWIKTPREDDFMAALRGFDLRRGASYMFPMCGSQQEMQSPEFQKKREAGPVGIITVFGNQSMGRNLGLTLVTFLVVSYLLAYLGSIALPRGATFVDVFRFFSTAAVLTFLTGIFQHAIWFQIRIVGHIVETVLYAIVTASIFAALWPAA